uniref:(California timema) hypothetical protein n=1 Tax=Timema californicum TaxID=61474 RepID=A0A7R9P420_TIMCA|nr:unnamed protein product [Timema californicum]
MCVIRTKVGTTATLCATALVLWLCCPSCDLAAVSEVLVQLSKRQGSTDNISVIVVFLTDPERIASRVLDDPVLWERLKNGSTQDMADQNNGIDDPKSGLMLDLDIPASFKQNDKNSDLEVQRNQLRDFDEPATKQRGETPTPPADTADNSSGLVAIKQVSQKYYCWSYSPMVLPA